MPPTERNRERAIEAWMLTIIQDGGVARLDDLHIDQVDALWKPREMWIQGGLEAFRLALMSRDRHQLRFTVGLGFSLKSGEQFTGLDFENQEEFSASLDWSPPSLYLFEPGKEPRAENAQAVVRDLEQSFLGVSAQTVSCYYMEFCDVESDEYRRSVFLEG